MKRLVKIIIFAVVPLLAACETDAYRTGDGQLSAMIAEFVEAHTDAGGRMFAVETDNGESLTLTAPVSVSWMDKADTVYRALLYCGRLLCACAVGYSGCRHERRDEDRPREVCQLVGQCQRQVS